LSTVAYPLRPADFEMQTWFLDLRRVLLLVWLSARWFLPYIFRRVFGLRRDQQGFGFVLRRVIEQMGITFVKLGQYLAIRTDILSVEICNELSRLMGEVPPVGIEQVRLRIESELGGKLEDYFLRFSDSPVGAASIAQVHRAITRDGMVVAVKVQRPHAEEILHADLRNLRRIGSIATKLRLAGNMILQIIDELEAFTLREVDFLNEARTCDLIRLESPPYVNTPMIRWDLTTRAVLTMEFFEGVTLLSVCEVAESGHPDAFERLLPGIDPATLVRRLAWACLTQAYVVGRFHGDPHPANIIIQPDGQIGFIDFGIFGELTERQRKLLSEYAVRLATGQIHEALRIYEDLTVYTVDSDIAGFRQEAFTVLSRWYSSSKSGTAPVAERLGVRYQVEMLGVMRRHRVQIQPDQVLFWRSQAVLDATAHRLPVKFDMLETVAEFFRQLHPPQEQLLELFNLEKASSRVADSIRLHYTLSRSTRLLNELATGTFQMRVERSRLARPDPRAGRRVKLIVASLALLTLTRLATLTPPALDGVPPVAGWLAGAAAGCVVISMFVLWRKSHR
jgi:ubiquinone biosynthesis protein